jgi:hypothetical protein
MDYFALNDFTAGFAQASQVLLHPSEYRRFVYSPAEAYPNPAG